MSSPQGFSHVAQRGSLLVCPCRLSYGPKSQPQARSLGFGSTENAPVSLLETCFLRQQQHHRETRRKFPTGLRLWRWRAHSVSSPVRCQEAKNALPTAIPRAPPSLPSGSAGNKREQSCSTPLTWPCSGHSTQHHKTCAALDVRLHLRLCVCPGLRLCDPHMHGHLLHYTVDP